jgi:hypothetical protein
MRRFIGVRVGQWSAPPISRTLRWSLPLKARYATAHWLRFPAVTTPDQLDLSMQPEGALSWKIGPSGPVGPDGYRLPSLIWCAVGLFRELDAARSAFEQTQRHMPFLAGVVESWHQLIEPFRHQGECNHLDRTTPCEIFEVAAATSPAGPMMVITTAGYRFGPDLKMERVIDFRRHVDQVDAWLQTVDGCLASRAFTPHTVGDDGYTFSVWRDEATMLNTAYRAGAHRTQLDRHKAEDIFDRSSFTRFRILDTNGAWNGANPILQS